MGRSRKLKRRGGARRKTVSRLGLSAAERPLRDNRAGKSKGERGGLGVLSSESYHECAGRKKVRGAKNAKAEQPSEGLPPIKRRRRKRVRLGEALRKFGLDEQTVAETYVGVVKRLRGTGGEPVQKLLVDILKECTRVLEPPRGSGAGSTELPTIVELHHDVPRPARDLPHEAETRDPL